MQTEAEAKLRIVVESSERRGGIVQSFGACDDQVKEITVEVRSSVTVHHYHDSYYLLR